jgi:hypothetical protein
VWWTGRYAAERVQRVGRRNTQADNEALFPGICIGRKIFLNFPKGCLMI